MEHKRHDFESLSPYVKGLLARVLKLYIRQNHAIDKAVEEVSKEVLKFKKILNKLKDSRSIYETEEVLDVLDLHIIDLNEKFKDLISKLSECDGVDTLIEFWKKLDGVGREGIIEVLNRIKDFSKISSEIFELLRQLDSSYKNLRVATESKNHQAIKSTLENVDPDFVKSVINAQSLDDDYGSPLHYVARHGDIETTRILMSYGVKPYRRLER
jgi:hypothetical protein